MSKVFTFITHFIAFIAIIIIVIVGLEINDFYIAEATNSDRINEVLLNLSYSYITGYLVYILTVFLPHFFNRKKIQEVTNNKYNIIEGKLKDSMRSVYPLTRWNELDTILTKESVLNQFENTSISQPSSYSPAGFNLTVIQHLIIQRNNIISTIGELIEYRTFLTTESMVNLEEIRDSDYFKLLNAFSSPILDKPSERRKLGEELFNLYIKVQNKSLTFS